MSPLDYLRQVAADVTAARVMTACGLSHEETYRQLVALESAGLVRLLTTGSERLRVTWAAV